MFYCGQADIFNVTQELAVLRECLAKSGALSQEVFKARLHHRRHLTFKLGDGPEYVVYRQVIGIGLMYRANVRVRTRF